MKKYAILYGVFAIVFGVTFLAFGIYLVRLNLAEMLIESMKDLGILAVLFFILLYIPMLLLRFLFWCYIIYGVLFIAAGIIALVSYSKGNLYHLKKNLTCFIIINSLMLFITIIIDFAIIFWFCYGGSGELSPVFIAFLSLTTVLSVAFEVIAVKAKKKLKQTIINEGQPL